MLQSILQEAGNAGLIITTKTMLICSAVSIILGLVISLSYMVCSEKYSKNFVITLVILPLLVQAVIMMVNGNLGTGVAIVGAFSLVRFRSIPGTSKEIGTIFAAMAVGLATGMGYVGFAAILTVLVAIVFVALNLCGYGNSKQTEKQLKIVIPENLNYNKLFDDILEKYTTSFRSERVKTTNLGSMYELTFTIMLKNDADEKAMIDEIRTRNGNLTVACGTITPLTEEL